MDRRQFLRNLTLACVAVNVPKVFTVDKKIVAEAVGSKGILWHIRNAPVYTIEYRPGLLTIEMLNDMMREYYAKPYNIPNPLKGFDFL